LDEAVKIVNLFVPSGSEVVSTRGKVKQWDKTYNAMRQPIDTVMPLAVLISRGSASASEIVSGALQDLDRAVVLGQRSFGKGLVQTTRNLSYNAKLKVTTAKYYIPSGRCIQALDYTHRDEDGAVGLVADSLITEYKTLNGRSVFDGGGISPDVLVKVPKYANVTFALVVQQMIFDYATEFVLQNKSIDVPEKFAVSEADYNQFIEMVKAKDDFKYESLSQEKFKDLVKTAKREGYYEKAKDDFSAMEELLTLDVEKDMRQFEDEIKELMVMEIVKRYYYQKGAIKASLQNDVELEEAKKLLKDMSEYNGLLDGTIASHAGDRRAASKKS